MPRCSDCRHGGIFDPAGKHVERCCELINSIWGARENEWRPDKPWNCPDFKEAFDIHRKVIY